MPANHHRKVVIRGKFFNSCSDACRFFQINRDAAQRRVAFGQSWEDAIECLILKKEQKEGNHTHNAGKLPMKPYKPWLGPTE
jgi:hypothetical protein